MNIHYIPRLIEVDLAKCNVFVGLRRAGKSYLMYQCIHAMARQGMNPEQILFFNFEDDRLNDFKLEDLDLLLVCYGEMYPHKPVLFLDELQVVEGWERFARRLADTGYHVFVTGSNAKMLSSEMAGILGGRYALTEVFPYSFREYLSAIGVDLPSQWQYRECGEIKRAFFSYYKMGGLPEVAVTVPQFWRLWLSGLFDRIYLGDIVMRNKIRKPEALKYLIRKTAESIGQPLSANRAAAVVTSGGYSLKSETTGEYFGFMADAFLDLQLENYAGKFDDKISLKKHYFIDNGLISLFRDNCDGELLENLVAVTLRRSHSGGLYYYKHNIEVDFYLPEQDKAWQACYEFDNQGTRAREINALLALHRYRPLREAYIVTFDEPEEEITENGLTIHILPIWKWLLLA